MSYAYQAAMWCDNCAEKIIDELNEAGQEDTGDTDDYPQYVHNDESDCPEHCDGCHEFLENSLTADGAQYVIDTVREDMAAGCDDSVACTVWKEYYDYLDYDGPEIERIFDIVRRSLFYSESELDYSDTIDTLGVLADKVHAADDVNWCLGELEECTLDALIVGAYRFCADYHGGQWSSEYELLCRLGRVYDPRCTSGPEPDSCEVDVYNALVDKRRGAGR